MSKKHVARELKVVFDTNVLHTQEPGDLVNSATRELIRANSTHPDLKITWCMPEAVAMERQYQMFQKAEPLLRNFQKLDAILGLTISLKPEHLLPKIEAAVAAQVAALGISRLPIDQALVDWQALIRSAALRVAPFQAGDTEKGFRDAIILETFVQLVERGPRSASTCRIVLVTNDARLTEAAKSRLAAHSNAAVLPGLEELRNLINTLISTVDESFVKELRDKAGKLFFVLDDKDTMIYREKLVTRIKEKFPVELATLPAGAELREAGSTMVNAPRFIRKERQRVHWLTQLEFIANAYRYDTPKAAAGLAGAGVTGPLFSNVYPVPGAIASAFPSVTESSQFGNLMSAFDTREKTIVKKGHTDFNVEWSTTVDKNLKLTRPQIDNISLVGTTWE